MKWLLVVAMLIPAVAQAQYGIQPQPMPRSRLVAPAPAPPPMEWQQFAPLQPPMILAPMAPAPVCQNICGPYGCQTQCY